MIVSVKVGAHSATECVVDGDVPYIDDLKRAIKSTLVNKFRTTDKHNIVVKDPNTYMAIPSTTFLTLTSKNGTERGSGARPFIIDAP